MYKNSPSPNISDNKIKNIIEELEKFISEIENDVNDHELKEYILTRLFEIRDAIRNYKYCGVKNIEEKI